MGMKFSASRLLHTVAGMAFTTCALASYAHADDVITNADSPNPHIVQPASTAPGPYQLNLLYTGEDWYVANGTNNVGNLYMQNVDAKLMVDTGKAFGWTDGNFVLEGWWESPPALAARINATDWQSPLETDVQKNVYRLYQAYYDQNFASTGTDVRFGIYDLETEFANTKPMSLFLSKFLTWNTVLDNAGTATLNGNVGPGNYPWTPLALRVRQNIDHDWSVQFVVADGIADSPYNLAANDVYFAGRYGTMSMGEVDYEPSKYTKAFIGGWYLSSNIQTNNEFYPDGDPRNTDGEEGAFLGATYRLYHGEGHRGLDGFFSFGIDNTTSSDVAETLNGGFVYTGLLDARPQDKAGVTFNVSVAPGSYRRQLIAGGNDEVSNYEPSFETTYRARITDWLTVQPDVQYIVYPGYDETVKNDLIFGLHFEIGHLFDW